MRPRGTATTARAGVVGVRIAYGALLLLVPRTALPTDAEDGVGTVVARVLGARHVAQGLGAAVLPRWVTPARSALVDATHAATMLGWAVLDARRRRQALVNAATACLLAVAEIRVAPA
ncbi:hypothetical protein GCM10023200_24270 [Actinomycetospora chlora]|uniref:Uncharacterized protein n=1 Tax=Actinomycetospora chlora TaxID=663608 RepID=A0ABP9B0B4_9PSEU